MLNFVVFFVQKFVFINYKRYICLIFLDFEFYEIIPRGW